MHLANRQRVIIGIVVGSILFFALFTLFYNTFIFRCISPYPTSYLVGNLIISVLIFFGAALIGGYLSNSIKRGILTGIFIGIISWIISIFTIQKGILLGFCGDLGYIAQSTLAAQQALYYLYSNFIIIIILAVLGGIIGGLIASKMNKSANKRKKRQVLE